MADVNKSIQINVEADLKHLLNNLQKMPNMTKKEAQKMVKTLSTELKKAEMAAKEAAKATQTSFKNIDNSAKSAAQSTRQFKKQTKELGGAVQATGDLIGELDPALGSAVVTIQMAGMAVRDLGKAFLTGNPIVLGVVAVIASLTAAYYALTASQREQERQQKLVQEATENANKKFAEQANIIRNLNKEELASQRELLVLTGQMTQLEADIANAKDQAKEAIEADLIIQNKYISEQQRLLLISKKYRNNAHAITDEERKTLEMAMLSNKQKKFQLGLSGGVVEIEGRLRRFEEEITKEMRVQQALAAGIQEKHHQNLNTQIQILEFTDETKKEEERLTRVKQRQADAAAAAAKEEARLAKEKAQLDKAEMERLKLLETFEKEFQKQARNAITIENQNRAARIALIDDEIKRKEAQLQLDTDITNQTITGLEAQKQANLDLAESEEQIAIAKATNLELDQQILGLREGLQIKEEALSKMRQKNLEEEGEKAKLTGDQIAGFYIQSAKAASELIKMVGGENKKAALIAFRVSQAAAVAEIAINTAKKVMEVAPNPFAMGAIGALGALQAATVLATPPPEFHMGGMIGKGDDTKQITALSGEAVIDRQTVQRLGGEKGVNALQRGNMAPSNQVIVIQPYKHFDRFVRTNQKRGGIMSKLNKVSAAGSY